MRHAKRLIDDRALEAGADKIREMTGHASYHAIVQAVCDAVDRTEDALVNELMHRAVDHVPLVGPDESHEAAAGRLDPIRTFHLNAIEAMRDMQVSVLTGPSGAERRRLLLIIADMHREAMAALGVATRVLVLASTRRDAMRMGPGASTVHQALGWDPVTQTFEHGAFNPIEADLILVDQADLLDTPTLTLLLAARNEATIVLTRDPAMLGSTIPPSSLDVEMEDETVEPA